MSRAKRREPIRRPANWGQGKRTASSTGWAYRGIPTPGALPRDPNPDDEPDPRVVLAAEPAGLDPEDLDYHLEVGHGWERHDEGYGAAIDGAVSCALRSVAAGHAADECEPDDAGPAEADHPDLCACGVPWADVPIGHSRGIAFSLTDDVANAYTCSDARGVGVEEFLGEVKASGDPADIR